MTQYKQKREKNDKIKTNGMQGKYKKLNNIIAIV